jgi:hypothetical protein
MSAPTSCASDPTDLDRLAAGLEALALTFGLSDAKQTQSAGARSSASMSTGLAGPLKRGLQSAVNARPADAERALRSWTASGSKRNQPLWNAPAMNRSALLERLAQACRHIAMGEQNIARLREIIARLERGGHDSSTAKELLARFEELQKLPIADRDRLEKELAEKLLARRR